MTFTAVNGPETVRASSREVSHGYFAVLDIPILKGRSFTIEEAASGAAVAVVSESAARGLWPTQEPIGQMFRTLSDQRNPAEAHPMRGAAVLVVGMARDPAHPITKNESARSAVYVPTTVNAAGTRLLIHVNGETEAARRALDTAITAVEAGAIKEIHKLQAFVSGRVFPFRAAYWVSQTIAVLALILAASGIYGVLSFLVTQRTKEIGIRMALGATTAGVTSLVVKQSWRLAAPGLIVGVLLALGVSKLLVSRMILMNTFDAMAYITGLLIVLASSAVATYLPARRATAIDPVTTLRAE
jgi:hypothetical protein